MEILTSEDRRKTYRIFISHAWDYSDDYERLTDLLDEKNYFKYENYSVPEHDPQLDPDDAIDRIELQNEIEEQIEQVTCVLIISGMYVNHSYWIRKEMEIAEDLDKDIIGIEPHGSSRVPDEVKDTADKMVGWSTDSIVEAIRECG